MLSRHEATLVRGAGVGEMEQLIPDSWGPSWRSFEGEADHVLGTAGPQPALGSLTMAMVLRAQHKPPHRTPFRGAGQSRVFRQTALCEQLDRPLQATNRRNDRHGEVIHPTLDG